MTEAPTQEIAHAGDEPELLTVSELARERGVAASTIRRWSDEGKLRAERTQSGMRLFRRGGTRNGD